MRRDQPLFRRNIWILFLGLEKLMLQRIGPGFANARDPLGFRMVMIKFHGDLLPILDAEHLGDIRRARFCAASRRGYFLRGWRAGLLLITSGRGTRNIRGGKAINARSVINRTDACIVAM